MSDEKKFDSSEYATLFDNSTNNFNELSFLMLIFLIIMFNGFGNNSESFLKGKIEAYENILKGFDDNER